MKYLRYVLILVLKLVGKIIGVPMFYLLLPFRAYARNRVYNYVLQNNVYLKRLEEREYKLSGFGYAITKASHKKFRLNGLGFIEYKKVSFLEYCLALFIWVWFDDDSNYDTHDGNESLETLDKPFGNTFDLGDLRAEYPIVNGMKTFKWICRNTFYNFVYMFEEIREHNKYNFYIKFPKIGWHFGFIPYSNSTRKGRCVYFSEDYKYLDKK
mgnify:CR=1 FL=1